MFRSDVLKTPRRCDGAVCLEMSDTNCSETASSGGPARVTTEFTGPTTIIPKPVWTLEDLNSSSDRRTLTKWKRVVSTSVREVRGHGGPTLRFSCNEVHNAWVGWAAPSWSCQRLWSRIELQWAHQRAEADLRSIAAADEDPPHFLKIARHNSAPL